MPVINRIAEVADDMTAWRRHLYQHPELQFACHKTAAFVVERLREFGVDEIHEGIAETGVVAIINGQGDGPTVGLRADMDALPMEETTGAEWSSTVPGAMHACGHDGHTTMLLGAGRYLAETRNFKGRVALVFQPAEEGGGGGDVMVKEGILDTFDIAEMYALHTKPGEEVGAFVSRSGPLMAAVDTFYIDIQGKGGHGAYPHECIDPIPCALAIGQALPTIVSRNNWAQDELVVSLTVLKSGTKDNIIPSTAHLSGTVRSFKPEVRDLAERRFGEIVPGIAAAFNVTAELKYERGYPATVNDEDAVAFAAEVAKGVGVSVDTDYHPEMGAEDFSYFLEHRKGAYFFLGNGDTAKVHNTNFDFDDTAAPYGASFFAKIVETRLAR